MIVLLFGSKAAAEILAFHALVDGNGTKPFRLASFPRLIPPQLGPAVVSVTATVADSVFVESSVDVAVIIAVSALVGGVNVTAVPEVTPDEALSVPPPDGLTLRSTVLVNAPVPVTVAVQLAVCDTVMLVGLHVSVTPVMVGAAAVTAMFAEPEIFVNPVTAEVAVQVPVPAPDGVNTPLDVIVPPVAVHFTAELYDPVPDTVAEHCDVCPVVIEAGDAATAIDVMVAVGLDTAIVADPEIFVNPATDEVAVQVAVPAPDGVNTPACVIVPPVAVHVTALL
jgi:hypothetical protein